MKKYQVAHILVAHKYEAEDLLRKIKEGEDFNTLAQKHSSCTSRLKGGDLGVIRLGKATPEFEDAALALQVGDISPVPIRTSFGYHLIKRLA
jgi:peptidyl-prolyl cis-trans isomerase C